MFNEFFLSPITTHHNHNDHESTATAKYYRRILARACRKPLPTRIRPVPLSNSSRLKARITRGGESGVPQPRAAADDEATLIGTRCAPRERTRRHSYRDF